MNITLFKNCHSYKKIFEKDLNNREINIYKFENCSATGHNLYYPNVLLHKYQTDKPNMYILPLLEKTMSLNCGTIYEKNNMTWLELTKKTQATHFCEYPLFFFVYNTDNYFHFLYDSLPYLISYFELKKEIPNLKLLMQYPNQQKPTFYPFISEFLEILKIYKEDIILINDFTIYKTIYVSTSYTHDFDSNLPPRDEIYKFYQNIVKMTNPMTNTPSKIYVSRRTWLHNDFTNIGTNYTTRRKLVNEDEIVEALEKDGFVEVFTEKLSTLEKIQYFANATHVVGAIGGGISNVLFSPKTTNLEVLVSPTFLDVNTRFKYSLNCVNVYYNMNSQHVETTFFKTYMRVKTPNGIVGEIEKIYDNKILVSYTDGSNTGWNAQNEYKQMLLSLEEVEKMDNGLNSPWKIYI